MTAFLYILYSESSHRFYIGSGIDVSLRLFRHNAGHHISTKPYRPWKLVHTERFDSLAEARHRERQIKNWKNPEYMCKTLHIKLK